MLFVSETNLKLGGNKKATIKKNFSRNDSNHCGIWVSFTTQNFLQSLIEETGIYHFFWRTKNMFIHIRSGKIDSKELNKSLEQQIKLQETL